MAEVGPLWITARNGAQAEYLVRSRADQRGVEVLGVEVSSGSGGAWVTLTVSDDAASAAALLGEDTQALHIKPIRSRRPRDEA